MGYAFTRTNTHTHATHKHACTCITCILLYTIGSSDSGLYQKKIHELNRKVFITSPLGDLIFNIDCLVLQ